MSAYMVSRPHIDALVMTAIFGVQECTARAGDWRRLRVNFSEPDADSLGACLIAENLKSIHARYPDCIARPDRTPGPDVRYWEGAYRWPDHLLSAGPLPLLTAVQAIKLVHCYTYQSCEHEGWDESPIKRFCDALEAQLVCSLPGYDAAAWELDEELRAGAPSNAPARFSPTEQRLLETISLTAAEIVSRDPDALPDNHHITIRFDQDDAE